jgi:MerR family transcriptional regulator, copper efflux regulator
MEKELTIGQVAEKVGLTTKTIRYYESCGVIKPLTRQNNSYRYFSERDVERLILVKRARKLGLSLSEIKNIVSECIDKGCLEARQYVADKVPDYIAKIETQIAELKTLKKQLMFMQDHYQAYEQTWQHRTETCCQIIPLKEE